MGRAQAARVTVLSSRGESEAGRGGRTPFLDGGGEMGDLIRATDWSRTPLGPVETWPQSLRTAVGIMLSSRYAMFVWWGPELTNLYNDAYRLFLGTKHPQSLGESAAKVWAEIWGLIGPRAEAVFKRAESTFDEALLLIMERFGYPEETYFTFSYSPIRNEHGDVGGLFCAVTEDTQRVIGERRLRLLREVAATSSKNHTPEQVCVAAAECISRNARDLPFALIYLSEREGTSARLVAHAGIDADSPAGQLLVDLDANQSRWPLAQAAAAKSLAIVDDLPARFSHLPTGAWDRAPERAVVIPLAEHGQTGVAGFLVAGLNPYLTFDDEYRGFVGLLAGQITAGIASARAYQEERRRAEALAEIDRAKTAFFSNVSHEFRTPLTLMLGPLEEALAVPAEALPRKRDDLAMSHRSGLRLLRLVNMLLDFSRIEAGRLQASYEPVDFAGFTAELASEFRAATERAGLRLTVDCPPLAEPVWIDRDMWEKIVLNLVSNAFKFTLDGGITVRVSQRDGRAVLSVEDTGIGIPARELPQVFDRFHRIEGARGRTHEGTGIGLALVQELTKLHGGSVEVESTLGTGSTFAVTVPLGTGHLPADRLRAERTLVSTATGAQPYIEEALRWLPGGSPANAAPVGIEETLLPERPTAASAGAERATVLLVDDNVDMREYVRRLLAPHYDVRTADDGIAALEAMRTQPPDLVLSDVMMPRLDGFGLVRKVRADATLARVPVILLSARAGEEASIEGLEAGADDYLTKPFSARELIARVTANLKMAELRRGFEQRIAADMHAMSLLQHVGNRCLRAGDDFKECLEFILDAAIELSGADKGNIQLLDPQSEALVIGAQRGFEEPFLTFFAQVRSGEMGAASAAMKLAERTVAEDVATSEIFAGQPSRDVVLAASVRAVYSNPLVSSGGKTMGMISVHFAAPHQPSEWELRFMDLLTRQAADYLERKQAEETAKMLVREVQHRSNNLLAVIQAIAKRSLSGEHSLSEAREAFEARLQALARANRQLIKADWGGAKLSEIIGLELAPFAERTRMRGNDLTLSPQQAQNFCLALHELATNAAKYGALSNASGKLDLSWSVANNGRGKLLQFSWYETGGPPVVAPTRRGFGTSLIKATFPDVRLEFAADGLSCEIDVPLGRSDDGAEALGPAT
jgi:signal transduction histidine kinase/FixJ family two-component response regulator